MLHVCHCVCLTYIYTGTSSSIYILFTVTHSTSGAIHAWLLLNPVLTALIVYFGIIAIIFLTVLVWCLVFVWWFFNPLQAPFCIIVNKIVYFVSPHNVDWRFYYILIVIYIYEIIFILKYINTYLMSGGNKIPKTKFVLFDL